MNSHPVKECFGLLKANKFKSAIVLLFLLNFLAGLLFINEGIFHYDGIVLAQAVENTYKTLHLQPAVNGRFGSVVTNCILYFPFFLLGRDADFFTRFSSVLFGALSVCVFFLFIYQLSFDFLAALFGSLLLSFTPFYFSPNTYGKEHAMAMFFLLLSFYLLLCGTKKNNLAAIAASSFIFAFAISTRESMFASLPLYFFLYLSPSISVRPFKVVIPRYKFNVKMLCAGFLPFLFIFAILFFSYLKVIFYKELVIRNETAVKFLGLFSQVLKVAFKDLYKSVPTLVFLLFPVGIYRLFRKENIFLPTFLLLWSMLIFYFGNLAHYTPRHLDVVIIPVYITVATILSELYRKDKVISCFIVIFLVFAMFIYMYPMLKFRHTYNGEKQFALFVKEHTEGNAIIITMDDSVFIEYYGKRKALNHPVNDYSKMHDFLRKIAHYLVNDIPVYLSGSGLSYDSSGIFRGILQTNFNLTLVGTKLSEDYHRPELEFAKYDQFLFKLDFKFKK